MSFCNKPSSSSLPEKLFHLDLFSFTYFLYISSVPMKLQMEGLRCNPCWLRVNPCITTWLINRDEDTKWHLDTLKTCCKRSKRVKKGGNLTLRVRMGRSKYISTIVNISLWKIFEIINQLLPQKCPSTFSIQLLSLWTKITAKT